MTPKRIAIVGAGPIGIEAAVYASALGHDVKVFERGDVASNVAKWEFISLFSPWEMDATPLGWKALNRSAPEGRVCPTGLELREKYLLPLAESGALRGRISTKTTVLSIGRDDFVAGDGPHDDAPFRLLVRDEHEIERVEIADVVLDCSGTYLNHRWAGRGGIPAPGERAMEGRIWYQLPDVFGRDRDRFIGRHTLVLGAGYSAATALHALGLLHRENQKTRVSWAIRRIGQAMQALHNDPLPARAALVKSSLKLANEPPHWLQYLGNCVLEKIDGDSQIAVTLRYMETDLALVVDEVIALVGYAPDTSIYEQLRASHRYTGESARPAVSSFGGESLDRVMTVSDVIGAETLLNPEPNFFILGAKSFGTSSNFLLQVGHKQIRDAFRILQADAYLDLYR